MRSVGHVHWVKPVVIDLAKESLKAQLERAREERDRAYWERTRLVAYLARCYPSGLRRTDIPGWDPCWHNCVYVDTPEGQMAWHYHDRDGYCFEGLLPYRKPWDGHSTPTKYGRLNRLTRVTARTRQPPRGVLTRVWLWFLNGFG